ncbi:MAG: hypothetical protein JXR88_09360 [Clostridia bacterium]|nr:hypothetical protein [Clostridia bacterium]
MTVEIIEEKYKNIMHPKQIQRSDEEIESLVKTLMEKMTWEEKTGQMYQAAHYGAELVGPALDNSDTVLLLKEGRVGSILSVSDEKLLFILQQIAVEETRLKIPLLFAYDVVHGYKTIFPINLAMACSFDSALIEAASKVSAMECGHSGIHMTFAPMIDIVRDPRWGRVMESFGEDVHLGSKLAAAYVKGFQQESLASEDAIAACGKHFIGYGLAEAGREYNTVDVSSIQLYNHYLPPFQSAIDADIASIMTSFNVVDNVPMTGNKRLFKASFERGNEI